MTEILQVSILPVLLTLAAYQVGLFLQKKVRSPLCNPILIAVVVVIVFLSLAGIPVSDYRSGTASISWLMTPATICLAIPMYEQFQILRKNILLMAAGIAAGAVSCLAMVLIFGLIFRFDPALTISMLPKSVTSAIGVPLSGLSGGVESITTAAIILTGIFAGMLGPTFCRWFGITHPVAMGVALGTSGHVIATARANEFGSLTGAASSLSLVVAGLLTATVFPLLIQLL